MKLTKRKGRLRNVWRFGKKYLLLFALAELCILVSYTVSLLLPLNLRSLTDQVLVGGKHALLSGVIWRYVFLFLMATVFNLLYAYVWQTLNNRYIVDVKNTVFENTLRAKASFLTNMNSGDIMSRIDTDSEQFLHVVQRNLFHFVNSLLLCAGIFIVIAKINGTVALLLFLGAALPTALTRIGAVFTEKYAKQTREVAGAFNGRLFELLKGLREIRLLCARWWADSQIFIPLRKLIALGNRIRRVDYAVGQGIYLLNLLLSLCIYGYSVTLVYHWKMTLGMFLAMIEYIALLHKKLNWMLRIALDWYARKISIDRVNEVLEMESERVSGEPLEAIQTLEFQNVSFSYDRKPVLRDVSLRIRGGERVAVVGASGEGKTTLISLLIRLYEPDGGQLRFNGRDASGLRLDTIRRQIGVVSLDIRLFDETVRYNLQFGETHTDDELWKALDRAGMRETIEALPQGLDTRINGTGYGLSGGQKQRLMIARLFLKRVSMIVLDEATSALDMDTESRIADELLKSSGEITVLMVSHRLAAIRRCDKIIVMDGGRVESVGTHHELINSSPAYRRLFGGGEV